MTHQLNNSRNSADEPPTEPGSINYTSTKRRREPSDALPLWERPEAIEAARLAYQGAYEADYDAEDCIAFALRAATEAGEEGGL